MSSLQDFTQKALCDVSHNFVFQKELFLGWKGYHPKLIPSSAMIEQQLARPMIAIAQKNNLGVFTKGTLYPYSGSALETTFSIHFERKKDTYIVSTTGKLPHVDQADIINFSQRYGHAPAQIAILEQLKRRGYKSYLFTPDITLKKSSIPILEGRYLLEKGYTERPELLPTDTTHPRFLLSLMALTNCNWYFFLLTLKAKLTISSSKAEITALGLAIKQNINPSLQVVQRGYVIWDSPKRSFSLSELPSTATRRIIDKAGFPEYGIPNGVTFMKHKMKSARKAIVLYNSFMPLNGILKRAHKYGNKDVIVYPYMARVPRRLLTKDRARRELGLSPHTRVNLMQLASTLYAQTPEAISLFIKLAKKRPHEEFYIIGNDTTKLFLPKKIPTNIHPVGWVNNSKDLWCYYLSADTIWSRVGNLYSLVETLRLCQCRSVVPFFLQVDRFTPSYLEQLKHIPERMMRLDSLMVYIETQQERINAVNSIVERCSSLKEHIIDPYDPNYEAIETIMNTPSDKSNEIRRALKHIGIQSIKEVARIYEQIVQRVPTKQIQKSIQL